MNKKLSGALGLLAMPLLLLRLEDLPCLECLSDLEDRLLDYVI